RLEVQTEASYRFERGTDREKMVLALERATQLIKELTDGEVPKGYIDIFVPQLKKPAIGIEVKKLNSLLGIELSNREIADNLARLGFELVTFDRERLAFNVPTHRIDISRDVDLIEEVARVYGYEKIPATLPYIQSKPAKPDPLERIMEKMKRVLLGTGFSETINYSFISARQLKSLGFSTEGLVELLNPISQDQDVMRPTLILGLINNFVFNFRRDLFDLQLFEIGASYHQGESPSTTRELLWLVAGISGNIHANWYEGRREVNFYDIKGVAQNLLECAGINRYQVEPATGIHWLHPGKSAQLVYKNERLCWFGELHPALSRQLELERRIYLLEMPLFTIGKLAEPVVKFTEIPRYPAIM
ncbi:MAG: phenylalanine--tRNA ligase beta subunit-related protein, partial [Candidatus Sumerlaeia bacterium]|nr:phenylalanine--tRNA ligase beta subunit-related protein [Candidatus Sumerlaeia bacterium]